MFLKKMIDKIDYFQNISDQGLSDFIYNLEPRILQKNTTLFKPDENADKLTFIMDGVVELYTAFEDQTEFVLERLYGGSVLNYRTFFMEDLQAIYGRCATQTSLLEITITRFNQVMQPHDELKRRFLSYQFQVLKKQKTYPLDYILEMPVNAA